MIIKDFFFPVLRNIFLASAYKGAKTAAYSCPVCVLYNPRGTGHINYKGINSSTWMVGKAASLKGAVLKVVWGEETPKTKNLFICALLYQELDHLCSSDSCM